MAATTVMLEMPEPLHRWLVERAARSHRSVEEETLDVLGASVPPDVSEAAAALPLLDDASLWRAARSGLVAEAAGRLEDLHLKRQREGLTADEEQARAALVHQYERAVLVRAEAAEVLHRRGHDVSGLVAP